MNDKNGKPVHRPLVAKLKTKVAAYEHSNDGKGALVECLEEVDEEGKAKRYWINLDLCKADREAQFFVREEMRKRVKERGSH